MSKKKKAANVQRKTVKDLQKAWRTIAQDHTGCLEETERNEERIKSSEQYCIYGGLHGGVVVWM